MKILLCGANGQVGWEVARQGPEYRHEVIALGRGELDISDAEAVRRAVQQYQPQCILNAAAYTAVDKAEDEPEAAFAINRDGAANLAVASREAGIPLLHISTDYVFDGTRSEPYSEAQRVCPLGVYGESKWEGEEAVRNANDHHIILRTAWVFGRHGNNFVRTMLRLGAERSELKVVADQQGAPTSARSIAACLLKIAGKVESEGAVEWGTYHFTGTPYTSWHGFASEILARACDLGLLDKPVRVLPITTEQFPTRAERPKNSRLSCGLIEERLGIAPDRWDVEMLDMLRYIRDGEASAVAV